jgi:hypothetical protein
LEDNAVTAEDEPNLVTSSKSQRVVVDGYPFSIEIYRLEEQKEWTLEVVDADGTSHVWDETFKSDQDAHTEAVKELEAKGAVPFMRGDEDNVVPFNPR